MLVIYRMHFRLRGEKMLYQSLIATDDLYNFAEITILHPFEAHWHNELELIYCISGSFVVRINKNDYTVTGGQAVFVSSFESHEYTNVAIATEILRITLGPVVIKKKFHLLAEISYTNPVFSSGDNGAVFAELAPVFEKMVDVLRKEETVSKELAVTGYLYLLSAVLYKYRDHQPGMAGEKKKRMKAHRSVNEVIEHIHKNYKEKITLDDASKICGYEKSSLCRQFKMATKMSFYQYLSSYRIAVACAMLTESKETIADIGETVGISEPKTFSRLFKKTVGVSPGEYRKQNGIPDK